MSIEIKDFINSIVNSEFDSAEKQFKDIIKDKIKNIVNEGKNSLPKFEVKKHPDGVQYIATDEHSYDGSSDGNNHMGYGDTKKEAIEDLCELLVKHKLYTKEQCKAALKGE